MSITTKTVVNTKGYAFNQEGKPTTRTRHELKVTFILDGCPGAWHSPQDLMNDIARNPYVDTVEYVSEEWDVCSGTLSEGSSGEKTIHVSSGDYAYACQLRDKCNKEDLKRWFFVQKRKPSTPTSTEKLREVWDDSKPQKGTHYNTKCSYPSTETIWAVFERSSLDDENQKVICRSNNKSMCIDAGMELINKNPGKFYSVGVDKVNSNTARSPSTSLSLKELKELWGYY